MTKLIKNTYSLMTYNLIAFAAIVGFSGVVAAETYKPAMFDFTGNQLAEKMGTISTGTHVLYCRADISAKGTAGNAHCFGKTLSSSTVGMAENAVNSLPFIPAIAGRLHVPVRMSFRISLEDNGSLTQANLVPNLGTMVDQYGVNYVAPQERLDKGDWYDTYRTASNYQGESFLDRGTNTRVTTRVKKSGKASDVRLLSSAEHLEDDAKKLERSVKTVRFIPGEVDGRRVDMDYIVAVNYGLTDQVFAAK